MSDLPSTPESETTNDPAGDDHGEALQRAAESIHEARDAEGRVAASGDITTADDDRAGVHSEDPDGEGGHP